MKDLPLGLNHEEMSPGSVSLGPELAHSARRILPASDAILIAEERSVRVRDLTQQGNMIADLTAQTLELRVSEPLR